MPWNANEFDTGEEGQEQEDGLTVDDGEEMPADTIQQLATQLTQPTPDPSGEEEVDLAYLKDVEKRLEVAQCYRLLTKGTLFEDRSPAAEIVEKELRIFIRERLSVLLNLKGDGPAKQSETQFTETEVKLLKVWAAALAKRPSVVDSVTQPAAAGKRPVVRKPAAGGIRQVGSAKPVTAPVAAAVPASAPIATPQARTPQARPAASGAAPAAPARRLRRAQLKPMVNADGEPLVYKDTGEPVMKNVTPQVTGSGMLPMPANMTMATAMKAQEIVESNANMQLGAAIAGGVIKITSTTNEE